MLAKRVTYFLTGNVCKERCELSDWKMLAKSVTYVLFDGKRLAECVRYVLFVGKM